MLPDSGFQIQRCASLNDRVVLQGMIEGTLNGTGKRTIESTNPFCKVTIEEGEHEASGYACMKHRKQALIIYVYRGGRF